MNKLCVFGLLGGVAVLAACQKDLSSQDTLSSSVLTVSVPQTTRAIADYGDGANINRCILEIYHDGELYGQRRVAAVNNGQATFADLQLVESQAYDFVLWADCADGLNDKHYNTTDLNAITFNDAYTGNNDEFDAFCASETFTASGSFAETVTLTRPFGQLTVKTNDMATIQKEELKPTQVTVSFKSVPTTFNVRTGMAGNAASLSYTAAVEDMAAGELTVDYVWAAADQADLVDFTMTFQNNGTTIATNDNFTNIPVRRNYRTNVSGNLITKQGECVVSVDPEFGTTDAYYVSDMEGLMAAIAKVGEQGGEITIAESANLDITPLGTALVINHPTTITINGTVTATDEAVQILNNSELTIQGSGAVHMARRVVENHGTLTVNGGLYSTTVNTGGTAFWNNDPNAVMTLNDVTVEASFFAVAGNGEMHINGGSISSTSSNKYGSWAYCVRAQGGAVMTIKDAVINGV